MNNIEPDGSDQLQSTSKGMIIVSSLSHKRAKQSDPRLAWYMFHTICAMYRDVAKKTEEYHDKLLQSSGKDEEINLKYCGTKTLSATTDTGPPKSLLLSNALLNNIILGSLRG